jgi:hypothetical protein
MKYEAKVNEEGMQFTYVCSSYTPCIQQNQHNTNGWKPEMHCQQH